MSMKPNMLCSICKLIFHDPISLPCYCVICNEHLHDGTAKNNKIKCEQCSQVYDIPRDGFATNKMVKCRLGKELHLSVEEKAIKNVIQRLLDEFDQLHGLLQVNTLDFEQTRDKHFALIQQQIERHRDACKARIDQLAAKMIDEARVKEADYKLKLIAEFPAAKKRKQNITDIFRQKTVAMDHAVKLRMELEDNIASVQSLLKEVDKFSQEIDATVFKESNVDSVGTFEVQRKMLISCGDDNLIKIWDLATNECVNILEGHTDKVRY